MERDDERKIEQVIPASAGDYLDRKPGQPAYSKPFVLDGQEHDLNAPGVLDDPVTPPARTHA
jgi:hypothetical protein